MATGNFTLAEHWSNNGLTPYNLYDNWLNSALDHRQRHHRRLRGAEEPGDRRRSWPSWPVIPTVAQQTADLAPIATYVAQNLPVIPVTTASEWFEYNSQHWVGWPTQQNPYETGQPSGTNNGAGAGTDEVVILHLSPR